jgi:competence protein ComEC
MGRAMSAAGPLPVPTTAAPAPRPGVLADPLWRAPLVPVVLAASAGVAVDRYAGLPVGLCLLAAAVGLAAWAIALFGCRSGLATVYLWLTVAALAGGYHHARREWYAADDIGNLATAEPSPARLRGVLEEEPALHHEPPSPLEVRPPGDASVAVLAVTHVQSGDDWLPASGRARLVVPGALSGLHVGDEVDVVGRLSAPAPPANPGEPDRAAHLLDQRIRAVLVVHRTAGGVVRLAEGWPRSWRGWLGVLRGRFRRTLEEAIPEKQEQGLAVALLLGDGTALPEAEWAKYKRTGVVHVLVVSGQQLTVLGWFLWFVLRRLGLRARTGAVVVAAVLLAYALLVGGAPPALRAAVMAAAVCGAMLLRRPVRWANVLSLAWLAVGVLNPADWASAGCQLSFLCVALIAWRARRRAQAVQDPLERLLEESRPAWQRYALALGRWVWEPYALGLVIWLAATPLVATRYNAVSPIAVPIMPPLVLLAAAALVAGFLLLLVAPVCWPLALALGRLTGWALALSDGIVSWADRLPGGHWPVGTSPDWWLWLFYLVLFGALMLESLRRHRHWFALAGLAWLCVGLVGGAAPRSSDELRCTFLAVGHGGCTVIETPDGRTLLYDAGAMAGPGVTERHVAPFLRYRGIQRVDELFLSHAHLDHYSGVESLLEQFPVGQVTLTPTFREEKVPGVGVTLAALERHGVPVRTVTAGDRLSAGAVDIEVLHPPREKVGDNEDERSLVLLVSYAGRSLLLTGDLREQGQGRLLAEPPVRVDVLQAPHHGSRTANTERLAGWARPRVVVSCQAPPLTVADVEKPYRDVGGRFLPTWIHGAVAVHVHETGVVVETYLTGERIVIRGKPSDSAP